MISICDGTAGFDHDVTEVDLESAGRVVRGTCPDCGRDIEISVDDLD